MFVRKFSEEKNRNFTSEVNAMRVFSAGILVIEIFFYQRKQ